MRSFKGFPFNNTTVLVKTGFAFESLQLSAKCAELLPYIIRIES